MTMQSSVSNLLRLSGRVLRSYFLLTSPKFRVSRIRNYEAQPTPQNTEEGVG